MKRRVCWIRGRCCRLAAFVLTATAINVRADVVDISWDVSGRFETLLSVAPGKFAEVCGRLTQGQSIAWSFIGDKPMNFNIHYHERKQVVFPAKQDGASQVEGLLNVSVGQDYCWMWTNKGTSPAKLQLTLKR